MKKNNIIGKIVTISGLMLALVVIGSSTSTQGTTLRGLDTKAIELSYKAVSPLGDFGGIALPASCESNAWNANGGYHLDGITADPGNCAAAPVAPATTTPVINLPPNTPVISGNQIAVVNVSTSNAIVATDPEGDAIFYELDWDCNGSIDGTTNPATASGVSAPIGHTYTSVGTKSVCGYAVQANDTSKKSGPGRYTITVSTGACTAPANACGVTSGIIIAGVCQPAPLPSGYGTSCSSVANSCGMRDNSGTIDCSGSCGGVSVPPNSACPVPVVVQPVAPVDPAAPAVVINEFRASPRLIAVNRTSRLYWDITGNIASCGITYITVSNNVPVVVTNSLSGNIGQLGTTPVTEKRFYKLKCGAVEREAIVSIFSLTEI